jgi:hypothetical protein
MIKLAFACMCALMSTIVIAQEEPAAKKHNSTWHEVALIR